MQGRIILARHGESLGNARRTFTESSEIGLTERGREQALRSGQVLKERFDPTQFFSSPYRRARDTAEIMAGELGLRVCLEADLREQSFGDLRGQPYAKAEESLGLHEGPRWEWRPPRGESLLEVQTRAAPVLERLARSFPDEHCVAVCHGGTIFALWSYVARSWERAGTIQNAELLVIAHDGERFGEPELLPP